jgi:hypothetical protein
MMLKTDDNKIAPDECANCIMPQCAICKHDIDPEPNPPEFPDLEEDDEYYDDYWDDENRNDDWDDDFDYWDDDDWFDDDWFDDDEY